MHCKIDDLDKNKAIKYPALYKSEETGMVVYVFDINEMGVVYYLPLEGKEPTKVQSLMDYHFLHLFTYFHGIAHLSN